MDEIISLITCKRCSMEKPPHKTNQHLCEECVKLEDNRVAFFRRQNYNWIDVAKEAGLELWERQPGETDHEWNIWLRYRDAYPSRKPSYRQVAEDLATSYGSVKKVGQRWQFSTRLQAWANYIDELTLAQRREEVLAMNKRHVDMASTLADKLKEAIDNLDPRLLQPKDINSLFKTAAELERRARLDKAPEGANMLDDDNPALKKTDVKTDDINEIVGILGKAGVLGNFGVRQTTTTEVVVKGDNDDDNMHDVRRR